MADKNIQMRRKNADGTFDDHYPMTKAANVSLADAGELFASGNVEEALAELFTSVSSGKAQLETAVTDMGGEVSKAGDVATFAELDAGVRSIQIGDYSIGEILPMEVIERAYETVVEGGYAVLTDYENTQHPGYPISDGESGGNMNSGTWVDSQGCLIVAIEDTTHLLKVDVDGSVIWDIDTYAYSSFTPVSVFVDSNDDIHCSCENNHSLKISGVDGSLLWKASISHWSSIYEDALDANKPLFVGVGTAYYKLNSTTGVEIWGNSSYYNAYAIAARNGYVYVAANKRVYRCTYSGTSSTYYSSSTTTDTETIEIMADGDIVIATILNSSEPYDFYVERWSPTMSTRRWRRHLFEYDRRTSWKIQGLQRDANDNILVSTEDHGLFHLRGSSGTELVSEYELSSDGVGRAIGISPDRNKIAVKTGANTAQVRAVKETSVTRFLGYRIIA